MIISVFSAEIVEDQTVFFQHKTRKSKCLYYSFFSPFILDFLNTELCHSQE